MRHLPAGIDVVFVLNMPKDSSSDQMDMLRAEQEQYGDLVVVPVRQTGNPGIDAGAHPAKTAAFLAWAAAQNAVHGYRFIAKMDTDTVHFVH